MTSGAAHETRYSGLAYQPGAGAFNYWAPAGLGTDDNSLFISS